VGTSQRSDAGCDRRAKDIFGPVPPTRAESGPGSQFLKDQSHAFCRCGNLRQSGPSLPGGLNECQKQSIFQCCFVPASQGSFAGPSNRSRELLNGAADVGRRRRHCPPPESGPRQNSTRADLKMKRGEADLRLALMGGEANIAERETAEERFHIHGRFGGSNHTTRCQISLSRLGERDELSPITRWF